MHLLKPLNNKIKSFIHYVESLSQMKTISRVKWRAGSNGSDAQFCAKCNISQMTNKPGGFNCHYNYYRDRLLSRHCLLNCWFFHDCRFLLLKDIGRSRNLNVETFGWLFLYVCVCRFFYWLIDLCQFIYQFLSILLILLSILINFCQFFVHSYWYRQLS